MLFAFRDFGPFSVKCIDRHVGSLKRAALHPNEPREGFVHLASTMTVW